MKVVWPPQFWQTTSFSPTSWGPASAAWAFGPAVLSGAVASGAVASGAVSIVMMGRPTSTVSPSATCRAATTPANGDGNSTAALAVSTSTRV